MCAVPCLWETLRWVAIHGDSVARDSGALLVVQVSGNALAADFQEMECAAWDPHSARLCTAEGGSIQARDRGAARPAAGRGAVLRCGVPVAVNSQYILPRHLLKPLLLLSLQAWDLRQRGKQGLLQGAHAMPIRHLDFAQQHADVLCSCGDDGRIRMWDLRWEKPWVPEAGCGACLRRSPAFFHWLHAQNS